MPQTLLFFLLIAVHVSVMVDCKPWQLNWAQENTLTHQAQSQPSFAPRHTEWRASNKRPDFLVILPVKTHSSNFVSIFDLRRKRFLCMDQEGELFNSRQRDTEDCLFQRLWLDWNNKHDVFYSTRAARLLKFQGVDFSITKEESSGIPTNKRHKLQKRMLKRQKRSEEINPSDPFRSVAHPPHPAQREPDLPNRDQTGAVSKETIASCDDPLKVLQTNGQVSPIKNNIGQISNISPILADQAEDHRHAQPLRGRDAQPIKKDTSLLLPPSEHFHVP